MNKLIFDCNNFLKDCGFSYAICGGYALELFLGKQIRSHSDLDISIFHEDRKHIVEFMLNKGWNVYTMPLSNKSKYLEQILNLDDDNRILNPYGVWAIKPECSFIELTSTDEEGVFKYEIQNKKQLNFDFIDIIFNKQQGNRFVFWPVADKGKNVTRELDKAVLYSAGIPYLSPEVMLFIISPPEYFDSDYHRDKNCIDFEAVMPYLPNEGKEWLIDALKKVYPDGHRWLKQLKTNTL